VSERLDAHVLQFPKGRARYYPGRAWDPKQTCLSLGGSCGSGTARLVVPGTAHITLKRPSLRMTRSGTRASTAAGRVSSSITGRIVTGSAARLRSPQDSVSMLSEGLTFAPGVGIGKRSDRRSRS
jgi:hypothetical protein